MSVPSYTVAANASNTADQDDASCRSDHSSLAFVTWPLCRQRAAHRRARLTLRPRMSMARRTEGSSWKPVWLAWVRMADMGKQVLVGSGHVSALFEALRRAIYGDSSRDCVLYMFYAGLSRFVACEREG